jgi:Transposase DDE domain
VPAYANGQRYLYKGGPERKTYSDPDATGGHRSAVGTWAAGSFYGYKLHQAVCADTGLPLAWRVETASAAESTFAIPLLESVKARGFRPKVAVMDMGYDLGPVYEGFEARGCHPVISLRETPCRQGRQARPPACQHGEWTPAGSDAKRQASSGAARRLSAPGQQIDRGRPAAHPDPADLAALEEAPPPARRGGAGERPAQARVGAAAATGSLP